MATQDDINNFGSANTAADLLNLAATTYKNDTNRDIFVATVNDLPDLNNNTIDPGTVFYVQSLDIPVIAHCGCWSGLDNRELRNDFNTTLTFSWGDNGSGQLGDNTIVSRSSPVSVVSGFTDWCQVSTGGSHSLGVRTNGTAWGWGGNLGFALGHGTAAGCSRSSPVSIVGGFTDWCQVSAGSQHSLGVRTDGTAWAWGLNTCGMLGDNTIVTKSSPVSVVKAGAAAWCQVSAGAVHSLGLRDNGQLYAWGDNSGGILGDTTSVPRSTPVLVTGAAGWCQVSAGCRHSLAVKSDGTAWAWGYNSCGALGDNTGTVRVLPVLVVGGFTDWCQVSAGNNHSLGVRTNGTAWAWGFNSYGRLGDNCATVTSRSSPVSVVGGFTDWCRVSAGVAHSLGVRTNGTAWAWGSNAQGRLGDNTIINKSSPVLVADGFTNWCQVSAGAGHSLGIRIM